MIEDTAGYRYEKLRSYNCLLVSHTRKYKIDFGCHKMEVIRISSDMTCV